MKNNKTYTIKPEQAQSIIDMVVGSWKTTLAKEWGHNIALKEDIIVEDEYYLRMRKACTNSSQHKLLDNIFDSFNSSMLEVGESMIINSLESYTNEIIMKTKNGFLSILNYKEWDKNIEFIDKKVMLKSIEVER